ncbi:MAG: hypothetical protein IKB27_04350 [Clostridia bacterium]|nr:hypothetical protein [Clostridia bacterium]
MKEKKYGGMSVVLAGAVFNFEQSSERVSISLKTTDNFEIKEIKNDSFTITITRTLVFEPLNNTYVEVKFDAMVRTKERETEENIFTEYKSDNSIFDVVYSRASLLIAQITSASVFGPIITAPISNKKQ